jgi:trans-aconitate 2-methyltransferase
MDYRNTSFTGFNFSGSHLPERLHTLLSQRGGPLRILDIGCGQGKQVLSVATALPQAHVVGIDVSATNIRLAQALAEKSACTARMSFEEIDYHAYKERNWDAVFSESTLHLIPDTRRLFVKIAEELAPGGILAATVPVRCLHNALLLCVRKLYRAVDTAPVRWLTYRMAGYVHPGVPQEVLQERLVYMRIVPYFLADAAFLDQLQKLGLTCEEQIPLPPVLGKLKHSLFIFRKSC